MNKFEPQYQIEWEGSPVDSRPRGFRPFGGTDNDRIIYHANWDSGQYKEYDPYSKIPFGMDQSLHPEAVTTAVASDAGSYPGGIEVEVILTGFGNQDARNGMTFQIGGNNIKDIDGSSVVEDETSPYFANMSNGEIRITAEAMSNSFDICISKKGANWSTTSLFNTDNPPHRYFQISEPSAVNGDKITVTIDVSAWKVP